MPTSAQDFFGTFTPAKRQSPWDRPNPLNSQSIKLPDGSLLPSDPDMRAGLTEAANRHKINPALLMALAQQESTYNPAAEGVPTKWGTAKGMFQFLDGTAKGHGIDPLDWRQSADAAAKDLATQIAKKGVDWAVAHHHAGPNPKLHGSKTARYTREVLAKAQAIAKELGINFEIPDGQKPDFSNVIGSPPPKASEFFGSPQPSSEVSEESTEQETESFLDTARRLYQKDTYGEAFEATQEAFLGGPLKRTLERGWEGIKNFLDRETVEVERTDEELRRIWDENPALAGSNIRLGISFDQWAERNRKVKVTAQTFEEEEAQWAKRLAENPDDAYLLPKRLSHLRPKADDSRFAAPDTFTGFMQRVISNHKNPLDLMLQDSIPANIVTGLFTLPETERKKFDQARQITQALEATNNPEGKSEEELATANQIIGDWKKRTDGSIVEAWQELYQAAKEDPSTVGIALSEAIVADPELLLAPAGAGLKPIRAMQAARVADTGVRTTTIARRAAKIADRILDAAGTTAAVNVAAGAAQNFATEGRVNEAEVKLNAAVGALLGGTVGALFLRGSRAKGADLEKAKLEGTYEEILRDRAKADVELEAQVRNSFKEETLDEARTVRNAIAEEELRRSQRVGELLGIRTAKDQAAWIARRRKEVAETFKNKEDYADYLKTVAEERIRRSAELAEAAKARQREAAEAAYGASPEGAAAKRQRMEEEFDKAIIARNAAEESQELEGLRAAAKAEDEARTIAQQLDAEEMYYAALSEDAPTIRQTEAKIKRRNSQLRTPKWQRGEVDPRIPAALALGGIGAAGGILAYPQDKEKAALAGLLLGGLVLAKGSKSVKGAPKRISQQGMLDLFNNNASGESSASMEAISRVKDEIDSGRVRVVVDRDNTVYPLIGVDAVDTFARDGQVILQRNISKDEWTVISSDPKLSKDLITGKINATQQKVKELLGDMSKAESQRGSADPETLARIGAVGAGAAAGFVLFPEDQKLQGTLLGGLAGLVIPAGGSVLSRMRQAGAISSDGQIISALVKAGKLANKLDEAEIKARDSAWIDLTRSGDQAGFKNLYDAYFNKIKRFANKFMGNRETATGLDAEDIAQAAFVKVYQKLVEDPDFVVDNFPAFVTRVAENEALQALRKAGSQREGADVVNESTIRRFDDEGNELSGRSIMDTTEGSPDYTVGLEGLRDTPELTAMRDESIDIIRQAFAGMSKQQQDVMTLVHMEHYTPEEAANQLGLTHGNVRQILSRGEQLVRRSIEENRRKLGEPVIVPRNQRGSADPASLQKTALITATALGAGTAGYFLYDGDPWKSGILGGMGAAGVALLSGKGLAKALRGIDYRMRDFGPTLYGLAKRHGYQELKDIRKYNNETADFITQFNNLPVNVKPIMIRALSTRDKNIINKMLEQVGGKSFVQAFDRVRKALDNIEDQLVGYGLIKKSEKDYFPFRVKDLEGLRTALGKEAATEIEAALKKAEQKALDTMGRSLNEIERGVVINKILEPYLGKTLHSTMPGFAKARTIQEIPEKLQKFYFDPIETLNSYGVQSIKYIERAKFFGRALAKRKEGGQEFIDIDKSIGQLVDELRTKGEINDQQAFELADILRDRFGGGERIPHPYIQGMKNLVNASLLGHISSAATQLGDLALQGLLHGPRASAKALFRQTFRKKQLDLSDFGLNEHVAHEFLSDNWTRKVSDWSFKWGGFRAIDATGKNFGLNAAVDKMMRLAKTVEGERKLADQYQRYFPAEYPKALAALKKGQVNEAVELLAFTDLTQTQPLTQWELPQFYHKFPNGRALYHLQTFSIRVMNMVYERALKDIVSGDKRRFAKGTKNLIALGTVLGVQGVATDKIKDMIAGRPVELKPEEVPVNALEALGMSMYDYNRIADSGPLRGMVESKLPPIIRISDDLLNEPERAIKNVPVVGRFIYDRNREAFEARRRKRRKTQGYKMEITVKPESERKGSGSGRRD